MYNKIECVTLTCDNCKENFVEYHNGYSVFVDENQANEMADNAGWHLLNGEHYCPACHEIGEHDELVVKNKEPKAERSVATMPNR